VIEKYLTQYNFSLKSFKKLDGYGSLNYKVTTESNQTYLLKVYQDPDDFDIINAESDLISHFASKLNIDFTTTIRNSAGESITKFKDGSFCRLLNFIEGRHLTNKDISDELLTQLGETLALLHKHAPKKGFYPISARKITWDLQHADQLTEYLSYIPNAFNKNRALYFFDAFQQKVLPHAHKFEKGFIHNDLNENNLILRSEGLAGIIDFGDAVFGPFIFDIGICLCYLLMLNPNPQLICNSILKAYSNHRTLSKDEIDALYYIIGARLFMSVAHSSKAKALETDTDYILGSEASAWNLLHHWLKISPLKIKSIGYDIFNITAPEYSPESIEKKRVSYIAPSLSTSYEKAIHFKSAAFQYMYDQDGNTYLDAYNNIPIVGHEHPVISRAVSHQIRKLNTNTRYNFESLTSYAEKLLNLCPEHLTKVIFVNSGSAASDLAVRIARTFTGNYNIGIIDQSYHGNTNLGIEISEYKYNGKGGSGRKNFVVNLPLISKSNTQSYSKILDELNAQNEALACIIAEPISGCGGQVPIHKSYMEALQAYCREKNIPFILDEVQTGFGRVGTHFWAHEQQEIHPDILILGKPIGNGHPLAAVVMTEKLAQAFDNGMEFFSSFGGNPVSCVVGETVLDIIDAENLQENALEVGSYFIELLQKMQFAHPEIKEVRGTGLFLGVELHGDNNNGTNIAKFIKEYLKANFVLTSTDGLYNNVLKIKPPLCFNKENVVRYCELLTEAIIQYKR